MFTGGIIRNKNKLFYVDTRLVFYDEKEMTDDDS